MIRDMPTSKDNPFDVEQVKKNINEALIDYIDQYEIIVAPNITNICYGRSVGYKIEEIILPKEIQEISATKIRNEL
jgi:hypothetical protein